MPNAQDHFEHDLHPRVFWSPDEIPALRAKAGSPRMAALLAEVLARCAGYCDPAHPTYIDTTLTRTDLVGSGAEDGHTWPKLPALILASILTDDPRWPDKLAAVLRVLTQDPSPLQARIFSHTGLTHHDQSLMGGRERNLIAQCGTIPLIYDLLHDRLAPADRAAARAYLHREIVDPFIDYLLDDQTGRAFKAGLGINIGWWEIYSCAWSLAAAYDARNPRHREAMDRLARRVRHGIHMGVDETGIIGEGSGYGSIELFNWLTIAEVLRRAGVCDLWQTDQRFNNALKARVYYVLPSRTEILDHGDTYRQGYAGSLIGMLLHAQRTGDSVYQQSWEAYTQGKVPEPHYHSPLGVLGYWLWIDPTVEASTLQANLEKPHWPLAWGGGEFGLHMLRTGWGEQDQFFAFFAAGRSPGSIIHQHTDAGHFALAALGEVFCAGRGYGHTPSRYHSVLQINGKEPADAPDSPNGQSWRGGRTTARQIGTQSDYLCADLAWQWDACWYFRHAMVIRFPKGRADAGTGAEPYVVMLDNCNYRNDWAFYDWQFQADRGTHIELDADRLRATVRGRKHRLELGWATYDSGEYPKPHRIELRADQTRHIYAGTNNPNAAEWIYDRLVARLHGYNGVMLSAMLPRRAGTPPVGIERLAAPLQMGLALDHGDVIDTVVASPVVRRITLGGIDAEATLVTVRRDRAGRLLFASAADCFALTIDGRTILPPQGDPRDLLEYDAAGDPRGPQVLSR